MSPKSNSAEKSIRSAFLRFLNKIRVILRIKLNMLNEFPYFSFLDISSSASAASSALAFFGSCDSENKFSSRIP